MEKMNFANILMAEDNIGDVRLTEEAIKENDLKINLITVADGVEAMEYLKKEGKYIDAITPDLVLLDLNMPRKDGREVLAEMKANAKLRHIPVIVLTVSKAERDIVYCYDNCSNAYIVKPLDLNKFVDVIRIIDSFWFDIVSLPPKE